MNYIRFYFQANCCVSSKQWLWLWVPD